MVSDVRAHVLLVTVTEVETKAVLEEFGATGQQANPQSIDGRVYFDVGTVKGARLWMTQSEMGASGLGASLQAISKGIAALSPAAVIMVGVAFGVSEERQNIGDILVAERLRHYDLQRVDTRADGSLKIVLRGDKAHSSPWLLNHLRSSAVSWDRATLRFGTVLTGEKLVDNVDFRDQLLAYEPEAVGGEMEGAGLYVACHEQKIDWILVKAICDFADGHKAQDMKVRQAIAARNAAAFVHHALGFVEVAWDMRHDPRPVARARTNLRRHTRVLAAIVGVVACALGFVLIRPRARQPPTASGYSRAAIKTIADDCPTPFVILATTYESNGSSYPWPVTRQTFRTNRQFKIVAQEPTHEYEVHLAPYEYQDNAYALIASCYDGATCNDVAAMYKAIVRSSDPRPFCGKPEYIGTSPVGTFSWSPDPHQNLPDPGDTRALCARINACEIATDRSVRGDPFLECQRDPKKFKISCGTLDPCDEVLDCLASIDAVFRSLGCAR